MPFLHSSTIKPIQLPMPILLTSFLLVVSHVSVAEAVYCEGYNENDTFTIAVPGKASFKTFVHKTPHLENPDQKKNYSGFCIDVFQAALERLGCDLPFTYVEFNGTYDQLVQNVSDKNYSAAVGDITILAERWKPDVSFTAPFTESGLTLVVPVRPGPKAGIFLKPFTTGMWLATAAVLVYTMFIVWFVERQSKNEEFCGPLSNQLGNALWFTFSSLFLAHRERIQSNYARIVVVVWLFLALVLTSSYTANLTSMLTVSRLQPKQWSPKTVGCDENAFMPKYIRDELNFTNIITIKDEDEYQARFKNGNISAAFLENPYAKAFVNTYCRNFTLIPTKYSFGGFGFIFQKKYSPLAADVSKAILQLSQLGELKRLEKKWLTPKKCSQSQTTTEDVDSLEYSETWMDDVDSLDLLSFRGLFFFSLATSSVCFLLFLGHLLKDYIYRSPKPVADMNENNEIV
ncbi:glutamate receptor 3.5-like [Rhododendron vialii]|uniref:glutamate receptor 3.5-like n=1 Tax=Rhododendron vialii TaxID=182163 RepID=UPI0026604F20|nr:glutamate receptor 3.5-like [Rhododendron vialii]